MSVRACASFCTCLLLSLATAALVHRAPIGESNAVVQDSCALLFVVCLLCCCAGILNASFSCLVSRYTDDREMKISLKTTLNMIDIQMVESREGFEFELVRVILCFCSPTLMHCCCGHGRSNV